MVNSVVEWVELVLALGMVLGFALVFYTRRLNFKIRKANPDESVSSGITSGVIRFTTIVLLAPIIGVLAIENIISPQSTMAVIGTIIGYVLTGFGE